MLTGENQSHNRWPTSLVIDGDEEVKVYLLAMNPFATFFIRLFLQLLLFSQNARKHPASVETVCQAE